MKSSFKDVLDAIEKDVPRPEETAAQKDKKNYAERLSRAIAQFVADLLRPEFRGILPDEHGKRHESKARSARSYKKLDVNFSTPELGLGLGVSIKTITHRDVRSGRYTKNYSRNDNELRAEAADYHKRQPYSVLVALIFLPVESCDDGKKNEPSSFGAAIRYFRHRAGRVLPGEDIDLFEGVFVGLYAHRGKERGTIHFFDVQDTPPKRGRPSGKSLLTWNELSARITTLYRDRNDPEFHWLEDVHLK